MDAATIKAEAMEMLAGLPGRISHVIRRHAMERRDEPALADSVTTGPPARFSGTSWWGPRGAAIT